MSHDELTTKHSHRLPRRRFVASAGILTAAAWLSPRHLFAEGQNIVLAARKNAESADITVQTLRGNVNALIGSGGNIAVLSGTEGKVVIDSGYTTSRGRITDALAKMHPGPIKHLVNTHWHFDHTDGNEWMHSRARQSSRMRILENTFLRRRAWRVGTSPSRRRPQARFPPTSSIRKKHCTLIVPLSPSPTMARATLTATCRLISWRLTSFTPAIPGGTVIIRSSIIPPGAISKA